MNEITIRQMRPKEREELSKLIRRREHLAKSAATERSKVLMADFEQSGPTKSGGCNPCYPRNRGRIAR